MCYLHIDNTKMHLELVISLETMSRSIFSMSTMDKQSATFN